ncbi:isoprenylcysteine carboxyl methyltransferase family protein [Bacillus safensis]|uniref:isoprenylcysteine carboxyl methyltransferase family protein n=1 Tax=Bacillus safensis TaxID=561879 RepID=UPI002559BCE1|nr:isoprenylcysteine carboxylmethyltransferase family protein [Bacillus safensis]
MIIWLVIGFFVCQRLIEMLVAKKNEKKVKVIGAIEFGASHYPYMIAMHAGFFLSLMVEVWGLNRPPSRYFLVLLVFLLATQVIRYWALCSLGTYWNTKILVVPNAMMVKKGPYRWLKHPNYVVVAIELMLIPLLFNAYFTAILFSCLNAWMMAVRIQTEEKALNQYLLN